MIEAIMTQNSLRFPDAGIREDLEGLAIEVFGVVIHVDDAAEKKYKTGMLTM